VRQCERMRRAIERCQKPYTDLTITGNGTAILVSSRDSDRVTIGETLNVAYCPDPITGARIRRYVRQYFFYRMPTPWIAKNCNPRDFVRWP